MEVFLCCYMTVNKLKIHRNYTFKTILINVLFSRSLSRTFMLNIAVAFIDSERGSCFFSNLFELIFSAPF